MEENLLAMAIIREERIPNRRMAHQSRPRLPRPEFVHRGQRLAAVTEPHPLISGPMDRTQSGSTLEGGKIDRLFLPAPPGSSASCLAGQMPPFGLAARSLQDVFAL